jgi:pimeloyl-ACP methyl ester carboxylesterase
MNKGDGSMIGSGRSALAARRDMVGGTRIFSRYSLAPVHSRQPVVLIHGMVIASGFYRRALKRIGNHHRAFAPDLPGYGRSDKPENLPRIDDQADVLAAWMDRLGLKDAVVAGVSLGSQFASALAARRPDLVGGLMLVSPTMDPKVRSTPGALVSWLLESRRELGMLHVALPDYLRTGARRASQTMAMALADRPEDRAGRPRDADAGGPWRARPPRVGGVGARPGIAAAARPAGPGARGRARDELELARRILTAGGRVRDRARGPPAG